MNGSRDLIATFPAIHSLIELLSGIQDLPAGYGRLLDLAKSLMEGMALDCENGFCIIAM